MNTIKNEIIILCMPIFKIFYFIKENISTLESNLKNFLPEKIDMYKKIYKTQDENETKIIYQIEDFASFIKNNYLLKVEIPEFLNKIKNINLKSILYYLKLIIDFYNNIVKNNIESSYTKTFIESPLFIRAYYRELADILDKLNFKYKYLFENTSSLENIKNELEDKEKEFKNIIEKSEKEFSELVIKENFYKIECNILNLDSCREYNFFLSYPIGDKSKEEEEEEIYSLANHFFFEINNIKENNRMLNKKPNFFYHKVKELLNLENIKNYVPDSLSKIYFDRNTSLEVKIIIILQKEKDFEDFDCLSKTIEELQEYFDKEIKLRVNFYLKKQVKN